jgi:hypothetical protein
MSDFSKVFSYQLVSTLASPGGFQPVSKEGVVRRSAAFGKASVGKPPREAPAGREPNGQKADKLKC